MPGIAPGALYFLSQIEYFQISIMELGRCRINNGLETGSEQTQYRKVIRINHVILKKKECTGPIINI